MGIVIRASGISEVDNERGSVDHAATAVRRCVAAAAIDMQQIDLLVNVGIYRDNNMCEPSMCSQIQHELGLHLDPTQFAVPATTFSFDLMNGACGFLIAVKVACSVLNRGTVERAVIVSSDAYPSGKSVPGFPHTHSGGAVLLERDGESGRGFGDIVMRKKNTGRDGAQGMLNLFEAGNRSRCEIWVTHDDDYVAELQAFSLEAGADYLTSYGIQREGLKLITSQPSPDFGAALAEGLGIDDTCYLRLDETAGDPHTSALTMGYHRAREMGQLGPGDRVLFVNAGTGLTVVCGLYVV